VYDVDQLPDGTPYVVMEFIEGRTLAEVLMFGPMEIEAVYYVAREILEALTEIHQAGIVHRDIKPSNILLEGDWGDEVRVRLVDFGIAKAVFPETSGHQLTQQGTMLGTPHYMAPEQITAQSLDERVDIYALGVVLYELLSGHMPFDGATVGEVIAAALRDVPRSLRSLRPDVPKTFEAVIMRAMARNREHRFASAHDMLCALHASRLEAQGTPVESPALALASAPTCEQVLTIVPDEHAEGPDAEAPDEEDAEPLLLSRARRPYEDPEVEGDDDTIVERDPETMAMLRKLGGPKGQPVAKSHDAAWLTARAAAVIAVAGLLAWPASLGDGSRSEKPLHGVAKPAQYAEKSPPPSAVTSTAEQLPSVPNLQLSAPQAQPAKTEAQPEAEPPRAQEKDTPNAEPSSMQDNNDPAQKASPRTGDEVERSQARERVSGRDAREDGQRPKHAKKRNTKDVVEPRAKDVLQPNPFDVSPELEVRKPIEPRRPSDANLPANPY
jgi:serine/threonine protein kinase